MSRATHSSSGRDAIRTLNRRAVLSAIHQHGQVSRIDLAAELELSPSALTIITSEFIEAGLVFEAHTGSSTSVGRKPILLEINYDQAFVIGVKVSNSYITTALTNLNASVVAWSTEPVKELKPEAIAQQIDVAYKQLLKSHKIPLEKVVGLGLGLPGIVEPGSEYYRYSALFGWRDVPLKQVLETQLGLPVLVDNDVNALAAAEAWFGSGQNHDSFLVLTLGRGVGLGIVMNGQVYRGPKGGAGEFGHVTLFPEGELCSCGKRGCIEAYLADEALLRDARKLHPDIKTPDELIHLAREIPEIREMFEVAGERLGFALSSLVNIFAPSLIILSGEGMRAKEFMVPKALDVMKAQSFGDLAKDLEVKIEVWGDDAWARGAAGLAASRYLHETAVVTGG
ncbi:MAG: ROK family transcriptional regulator [Trueperaceae bacterium]|nr:ROK family transcriptional regulator [Trueperaceae bacterium]